MLSTDHTAIARDPLTLRWSLKPLSRVRSDSLLSKRMTFGQNIVFILHIRFCWINYKIFSSYLRHNLFYYTNMQLFVATTTWLSSGLWIHINQNYNCKLLLLGHTEISLFGVIQSMSITFPKTIYVSLYVYLSIELLVLLLVLLIKICLFKAVFGVFLNIFDMRCVPPKSEISVWHHDWFLQM